MESPLWIKILRQNVTSIHGLLDFCQISEPDRRQILTSSSFSMSVPQRFVKKMEKGNIHDPLFRQFVPIKDEERRAEGFVLDPLHESEARCVGKLLQKYNGRVLVATTKACGMHCRFCFRRHCSYDDGRRDFDRELQWIANHQEIEEVIFSGGDPLALPTETIQELLLSINDMPHIRRVRFHTRLPIGIPERIDTPLLEAFQKSNKKLFMVFHINHQKELDEDVEKAFQSLSSIGMSLLSQTVLLKGVNDSVDVLEGLMKELGNAGVIPYYLHQLDRVDGASHFEVEATVGLGLVEELQKRLSGFLIPRYVQELPGRPGKTLMK